VILLKNIGSEIVEFDSIVQGGPNFRDFTFTEKYKKFSLAPGESKTVTLRFIPKELGLTNGRLMAYYKGIGSPSMMQLYGEGIPRILPIESLTVNKIDTISMERRGISENTYVIGNDRNNQTLDTLSDKILAIDSLFRTDTLLKPMIIITGQITAVGVESDGRIINKPIFKIDLNTSNKYEALLPYVFYEEGSDIIPDRYYKLNNRQVANFTIDQLWYKSTINIYHDILNIIGKRLTMYPKSVLTIQGNNANTGIEKENTELSRRRAENVKQYLQDIWGIKENRLIIKAGNLPKAKSLPIDDPETAQENRRVEFSSNDYRVIEPLDLKNTMATSNPPKVRFNVQGAADFGIASYTIDAIQAGFNGNSFNQTETSSLPNTIDWEIAKNQALTPKLAKPVSCSLTIIDKKGNSKMVGTDQMDIDLITIERKIKEHINGYEVDSFSLILFDFNKSDIENENKKIISAIQKRIKKGSEISVIGTTDRIGTEEYNTRLSQERANAVKTSINRKGTISIGKGEQDLRFDNNLPEGRFYCRTVNVVVKTLVK
jgi:outer membrane protein OmpA-like peptidoglycan-associated protein